MFREIGIFGGIYAIFEIVKKFTTIAIRLNHTEVLNVMIIGDTVYFPDKTIWHTNEHLFVYNEIDNEKLIKKQELHCHIQ